MLIVTSEIDKASMNILEHLLKIGRWHKFGKFEGRPAREYGNRRLVTIHDEFLFRDDLDAEIRESLGIDFDVMVFASRHKSESGLRSLTVHPLGNYDRAEFGGQPRTLVPTSPALMTTALRLIKNRSAGLDFHMSVDIQQLPVAIGIGGGHYAPRITDVALEKNVAFGHMVPTYALECLDQAMLEQVIEGTPDAVYAYLHRKAMSKPKTREMSELCGQTGLRVVRTRDLD
jgi:D-aminoacyl-tRNA deacylase